MATTRIMPLHIGKGRTESQPTHFRGFPDSSNTEYPGFSSAHFFALFSDLNAPFCEEASAHDFRTRYQASAGLDVPPAVPRMPFRMSFCFSPFQ